MSLFAAFFVVALGALGTLDVGSSFSIGSAHAIVGRPFTPVSVAGVARRTTRRNVYGYGAGVAPYAYGARYYGAAAYGAAAATAATLSVLPTGCNRMTVTGSLYYGCAGTYYRPVYDGPDVVYVQVQNPQ